MNSKLKQNAKTLQTELRKVADSKKITNYKRFFKTGPGEYGEGDMFIGITVPMNRKISQQFRDISMKELEKVLKSKIHEERLSALIILNGKVKHQLIDLNHAAEFYLKNKRYVNNWDLVDSSAAYILGPYIFSQLSVSESSKQISAKKIFATQYGRLLFELINSENLWDRRIAVLASFYFIRQGQFQLTIAICEMLMNDEEDLMHKACGWMLREMGKTNVKVLLQFLHQFAHLMPRTMLRYSIEKLDKKTQQKLMSKKLK